MSNTDGVRVVHVPRARTWNDRYNDWASSRREKNSSGGTAPAAPANPAAAPRRPSALRRLLGIPSEFTISYAGSLYLGRDLSPLVQAIRAFVARQPAARGLIKLRIAGTMDAANATRFWREVDGAQLRDDVAFLGRVPNGEALSLINRSHVTVVPAQDQVIQVPAKLYECVAMGVPTLVVTEDHSESVREARRIGAFTVKPGDVEGMGRVLEQLWAGSGNQRLPASISCDAIDQRMASLGDEMPGAASRADDHHLAASGDLAQ